MRYLCLLAALLVAGCAPDVPVQSELGDRRISLADSLYRYLSHDAPIIALVGVQVLDGTGTPAAEEQTVVIDRGRIAAVGRTDAVPVPQEALVLRLPGRTVIPGLVGMHDHTHIPGVTFTGYTSSRLWLAGGVTTVQTAGAAEPLREAALARAIDGGTAVGSSIYVSATYVTGPGGNGPMPKPISDAEARAFVRQSVANGATWFKLYRHVKAQIAAAVIDEAHEHGARVTGHLCSLTFAEAASLGIDRIEHGLSSATDFVADKPLDTCVPSRSSATALSLDDPRVAALIDTLVARGVTITSTLAISESHFAHRPQADARTLALFSPEYRRRYDARQTTLRENAPTTGWTPDLFAKYMAFERRFVEAGGRLVMGPDPGRHVLPGYGNQRGFELLVEAGFSVPAALQVATANGADVLGVGDRLGRVAAGYDADLVVLNGDLAADAAVIRNVEVVFKRGVGFDPNALLAEVAGFVGER